MPILPTLPWTKIGTAVVASGIALLLPLFILSHEQSIQAVKNWGYWLTLGTCGVFLWALWRDTKRRKRTPFKERIKTHGVGVLLALILAGFLQGQDEQGFKILFDEHVLSATAKSMHTDQIAYTQATTHVIGNETVASIGHVDKRPILFPFVLSVVHNLFGYDYGNVFWLNAFLGFATLLLLYSLLASVAHPSFGWLGMLLFAGLPLLAQNANGGGYELLNLALLLGLALSAIRYFNEKEDGPSLNLMLMVAILLANVRYESILYVLVPAAVFLLKSIRDGRMQLTWFSTLSPLFLMLPLMSFEVFRHEPRFIRTSQDNFFSLSHLPENLAQAITYLFEATGDYTNSVLLSAIGLAGILLFLVCFLPRTLKFLKSSESSVVFTPLLLIILLSTTLALSNHWGGWTDPATSRFSLPLHLAMVVCATFVLHKIFKLRKAPIWLLLIASAYTVFVTPANCFRMRHEFRLNTSDGYHWVLDWIENESPEGNHLYIAESSIGISLLNTGAMPFVSANAMPERIAALKRFGIYDEVYLIEELVNRGDQAPKTLEHLTPASSRFQKAPVASHSMSPTRFYQISRLVSVLDPQLGEETKPANLPPVPPAVFNSSDELDAYYLKLLPLVPSS